MAKKSIISSAVIQPLLVSGSNVTAQDGSTSTSTDVETDPAGKNGSAGTNTPESEAEGGAGNSASPSLLADINGLANALTMSGCADFDDLVEMALVGRSLTEAIATHTALEGPLKGWSPAGDPAEIVGDLVEMIYVGQEQLKAAKTTARASEPSDLPQTAKRTFEALGLINIDNELVQVGGDVVVDRKQHAALAASGVVDPDWDEGV